MTDENRDPVTDDAGTGSDEARLFTPGNGGRPAEPLMSRAPGSRNGSEETSGSAEESDESDESDEEDLDETADIDEEDLDEDEDEDEDLLDEEEDEDDDDEAGT